LKFITLGDSQPDAITLYVAHKSPIVTDVSSNQIIKLRLSNQAWMVRN